MTNLTNLANDELLNKFEASSRQLQHVIHDSQQKGETEILRHHLRAELLRRLGAAVSASPQPRDIEAIANKIGGLASYWMHPQSEALVKFKADVTEILAQFFAAAPVQEPQFSAEFVAQQEELRERDPELYEQAAKNAVRLHEKLAAQEQPVAPSPQKGKP